MRNRDVFRSIQHGRDRLADLLPVRDPRTGESGEIEADFSSTSVLVQQGETSFSNMALHTLRVRNDLDLEAGLEVQWRGHWWRLDHKDPQDEFDDIWRLTACVQPVADDTAKLRRCTWKTPGHTGRRR